MKKRVPIRSAGSPQPSGAVTAARGRAALAFADRDGRKPVLDIRIRKCAYMTGRGLELRRRGNAGRGDLLPTAAAQRRADPAGQIN